MSKAASQLRRGSYGIDAPIAAAFLTVLTVLAVLYLALAILSGRPIYLLAFALTVDVDSAYL